MKKIIPIFLICLLIFTDKKYSTTPSYFQNSSLSSSSNLKNLNILTLEFENCFTSYESVKAAIDNGTFNRLIPEQKVTKEDFKDLNLDINELWESLVENQYIDKDGNILKKFKDIKPSTKIAGQLSVDLKDDLQNQMPLPSAFRGLRIEIYNIIRKSIGFEELWKDLSEQTSPSVPIQKTITGHLLRTVQNVDEIVDEMIKDGEITKEKSTEFRIRARRLMFFHDFGNAFAESNNKLWQRHESLSAEKAKNIFQNMEYNPDEITKDIYLVLHHGTIGWLPMNCADLTTDREETIMEFVTGLKNKNEVLMLKIMSRCDVANRSWFLSGEGTKLKINTISKFIFDIVSNQKNPKNLMKYLQDRKKLKLIVEKTALFKNLDWKIKATFVDLFVKIFNLQNNELSAVTIKGCQKLIFSV